MDAVVSDLPAPCRRADARCPGVAQEREVAEVVELRVAELARPEVRAEEVRDVPTRAAPRRIRLRRVGHHEVWGANQAPPQTAQQVVELPVGSSAWWLAALLVPRVGWRHRTGIEGPQRRS